MNISKPKILCVDDEPVNLKLLEAMLVPRGYDVLKADNGKEALEKINEQNIDLVLLDVMMPEMNGFDVCRKIKEDEAHVNVPVVMITALRSKEDRIKGIEAGAEDFISKPFDQTEVLARIKMLLKIKELNDRLNQAYSKITAITSFGRKLINSFDPLNYDFMSDIDHIVSRIIRDKEDITEKPQIVLVHFPEGRKDIWFMFEAASDGFARKEFEFDFDFDSCISEGFDKKIVFFNGPELDKTEFYPIVKKMESLGLSVNNIVSYLSSNFCIAALNYGRKVTKYDASVLESFVMQSLFLKSLSSQVKETDDAFAYTVHALARAAEVNDEDTGNHILRVGEYCGLISEHLGMPEKFIKIIRLQALMHDVGKIHIPPEILKKPGKLTQEEFELVKQHPLHGAKILGDHVRLAMAKEITLSHHERWDGGGYPYRLKGDQIPFTGRIINIADIYDALRNKRVYKPAFDHETTFRIITEGDGRTMPEHFDPQVLKAFKDTALRMEEIYETLKG